MEEIFFRDCDEVYSINTCLSNPFVGVAQLNDKSRNRNTTRLTVEQRTIVTRLQRERSLKR